MASLLLLANTVGEANTIGEGGGWWSTKMEIGKPICSQARLTWICEVRSSA